MNSGKSPAKPAAWRPKTDALAVRCAMRLWRDVFRLENLPVVAEAAGVQERHAARILLRLYENNLVRMAAVTAETLSNSLKRDHKQERQKRKDKMIAWPGPEAGHTASHIAGATSGGSPSGGGAFSNTPNEKPSTDAKRPRQSPPSEGISRAPA